MSTSFPSVDIVTVTYNRHTFLASLQNCILSQDYPHEKLTWIIVDDSDDGSPYFKSNLNLKVIYCRLKKKLKLGAKRNYSHSLCKSDIIVYMDDDDFYMPSRVSHAVETLQSTDALIAGSSLLPVLFLPERELGLFGPYGDNHSLASTFAFRRELLLQTSYEDSALQAEEKFFLKNYTIPLKQLDPNRTILCIAHYSNTFEKRRLKSPKNPKFKQINIKNNSEINLMSTRFEKVIRQHHYFQQQMPLLRVVITSFNEGKLIGSCLESIRLQKNCRMMVDVIDDCSTDDTVSQAVNAFSGDSRFHIHVLDRNLGPMGAFWEGIQRIAADDDDVIVWIDADDQLASPHALYLVAATYAETGCWLTYGSFINSKNKKSGSSYDISTILNGNYRQQPWLASHLKTFKVALWRQLNSSELKDLAGQWIQYAPDLAVMFPLLELAGFRQQFIPDLLYCYNDSNPKSLTNTQHTLQSAEADNLRRLPARQRLQTLPVRLKSL